MCKKSVAIFFIGLAIGVGSTLFILHNNSPIVDEQSAPKLIAKKKDDPNTLRVEIKSVIKAAPKEVLSPLANALISRISNPKGWEFTSNDPNNNTMVLKEPYMIIYNRRDVYCKGEKITEASPELTVLELTRIEEAVQKLYAILDAPRKEATKQKWEKIRKQIEAK